MFVKPDVHIIARMLIHQHGAQSHTLAIEKADELSAEGNSGGFAYWTRVIQAIEEELDTPISTTIH